MFRPLFLFYFTTLSFLASGQSYKDDIKAQFLKYTELLVKKDFSKSVEYINPKFFTFIPKAQLIKIMEQTYNNAGVDFEIEMPTVVGVDDKVNILGHDYVKLRYTNYLKMRFKTDEVTRKDTTLMKGAFENQFGLGNVNYDSQTGFYRILVNKKVVANTADNKRWTFVVIEEKQKPILEKILPKELL